MDDIKRIIRPVLKWWWLIAISTLLTAVTSVLLTSKLPLVYRSDATLLVGRAITDPNPNTGEFYLGQQLAIVYAELGNRDFIRQATMQALNLHSLPEYNIRALPNSQIIEIAVDDTNPERAQAVANELAVQIIQQSPTETDETGQERLIFLSDQLDYLQEKITETQEYIASLQLGLADLVSASEIADTQVEIEAQQSKLIELQGNYAALLDSTLGEATNTITVIDRANLPTRPIGPSSMLYNGLSAAAGLILGIGAAYLLEGMDNTLTSPEDFRKALQTPIVGMIPASSMLDGKVSEGQGIHIFNNPSSVVSESFYLMRANLQFIWGDKPPKTILVTSMMDEDGKTSVAVNLAATMAKTGRKVLLVDADLRNPNIHSKVGFDLTPGFTDSILEHLRPTSLAHTFEDDRLKVLARGSSVEDPSAFLDSIKILQFLSMIDDRSTDLMIIDGPPLFVADGLLLASRVEGVLLVVRPGRSRAAMANFLVEQLKRSEANLLGIVVNAISKDDQQFYGLTDFSKYKVKTERKMEQVVHEADEKAAEEADDAGAEKVPPFKE
jgi:succinoglycan biosynthesis transport protein ExoP